MIQLPTEFRATLESYQGPLDLLLYLIKKEEVDILEIPIGRITEQYMSYLSLLQAIDPNACGEFLTMAAHLMEIKSRCLLPTETEIEEGEMEDPRIELVRQLLEYKKYKERALLLQSRMEERSRRFHRPRLRLPDAPQDEADDPMEMGNVSVWDLLSAFHRVQLALGERGPHRVMHQDRPLDDYIRSIQERFEFDRNKKLLFDELFSSCRDVYDAIGYFIAILEMAKRRLLRFHQEVLFGPIEIEILEVKPLPPAPEDREGSVLDDPLSPTGSPGPQEE